MNKAVQVHTTPRRPWWSVMELRGQLTADDASALVDELVERVACGVTEIVVDARNLESSEHALSPLLQQVGELLAPAGGSVIVTSPPSELGAALTRADANRQHRITLVGQR